MGVSGLMQGAAVAYARLSALHDHKLQLDADGWLQGGAPTPAMDLSGLGPARRQP